MGRQLAEAPPSYRRPEWEVFGEESDFLGQHGKATKTKDSLKARGVGPKRFYSILELFAVFLATALELLS